jgi:outer membrane lipopolysaccharide assembly protein LptE/RlpB
MKKLLLGILIGIIFVAGCGFVLSSRTQTVKDNDGYMTLVSSQKYGSFDMFYVLIDNKNNNICYMTTQGYSGSNPMVSCLPLKGE